MPLLSALNMDGQSVHPPLLLCLIDTLGKKVSSQYFPLYLKSGHHKPQCGFPDIEQK